MAAVACLSVLMPLIPPLKISRARMTVLPHQRIQLKAAKTASARAAAQTEPRQKSNFPRKTARAMKPAK
jgi:hypothetical protein